MFILSSTSFDQLWLLAKLRMDVVVESQNGERQGVFYLQSSALGWMGSLIGFHFPFSFPNFLWGR